MIVEYIKHQITKPIKRVSRLFKLLSVLDKMDIYVKNNNVYIKMDSTLILNNEKDILLYSDKGKLITKHLRTHINPDIKINIKQANTIDIDSRSIMRNNMLKKQNLFLKLLKQNKIKQMV